jgi:hypothetical protein
MKSPSLAHIKVGERMVHPLHGNATMVVKLADGTIICAFKQGGMNLWAFAKRGEYSKEWLALFDRRMLELWEGCE